MTHRVSLSESEEAALLETFRTTTNLWLRERCQALLMVARGGRTREAIALDLDVSPRTLQRYVLAYLEGGIEALEVRWYKGPQHKIPEALGEVIEEWVIGGPMACGLDRANWTFSELAHHLFQTHGIKVCAETMRQFCLRRDIRPYRPTYRFLRGDPDKQKVAREELETLKKRLLLENSSC